MPDFVDSPSVFTPVVAATPIAAIAPTPPHVLQPVIGPAGHGLDPAIALIEISDSEEGEGELYGGDWNDSFDFAADPNAFNPFVVQAFVYPSSDDEEFASLVALFK